MNLLEIIERYDKPETLAKLTEERIREIFTACSHAETPAGRIAQVFILNDPGKLERVREVKQWAIEELKRRDLEAGEPSDRGSVPQGKIHIAHGKKTDVLRVLDILHEMRFFSDGEGQLLTKSDFIAILSTVFDTNALKNYEQCLSEGHGQSLEQNTKVFNEMADRMKKRISEKDAKKDARG